MSDTAAASLTAAIIIALLGLAAHLICRAYADHLDRRAGRSYLQAHWDEATQSWSDNDGQDVGPDQLLLLEDLDAHLDAHFTQLAGLFEELGPPPTAEEGLAALQRAVHDEQNNTQGDS